MMIMFHKYENCLRVVFKIFDVVWMQISLENGGCCVLLLVVIYMLRGVG